MTDQNTEALPLNGAGTHVHVVNTETGGDWECPVDYYETAKLRGWVATQPRDTSLDGLFDPGTGPGAPDVVEQTGFNPDDHTVADVNDHLAKHADASPGEVARVLAIEADGQARKGVLEGPYAPTDPDQDPPAGDPDEDPNA